MDDGCGGQSQINSAGVREVSLDRLPEKNISIGALGFFSAKPQFEEFMPATSIRLCEPARVRVESALCTRQRRVDTKKRESMIKDTVISVTHLALKGLEDCRNYLPFFITYYHMTLKI